jgi:hypothetical protein
MVNSLASYAVVAAASAALVSVSSVELGSVAKLFHAKLGATSTTQAQLVASGLSVLLLVRLVHAKLTTPPAFDPEGVGSPRKPAKDEAGAISSLPLVIKELGQTFGSGRTRSYAWRIQQLRGLQKMLSENSDEIYAACKGDCGKAMTEWFFEMKGILNDCDIGG